MLARAMHTWREGYKGKCVRQAMQLFLPSCRCRAGTGREEGGRHALQRALVAAPVSSGAHMWDREVRFPADAHLASALPVPRATVPNRVLLSPHPGLARCAGERALSSHCSRRVPWV